MTRLNFCISLLTAVILSGCHSIAVGPRPAVAVEDNWRSSAAVEATPLAGAWWSSFGVGELDQLIALALEQNPDLRVAAERVRQAELQMAVAGATLFPSLSAIATSGESRSRNQGEEWQRSESSRASLSTSYEVDLWGRVSAGRAAASASAEASRYDLQAAQLSLAGAVSSGWFQYLALQERLARAEQNLAIAKRLEDIVSVRYQQGVASGADLARQRSSVLSQEASLLPLQLQLRQTRMALAVLLGESPQTFSLPNYELMQVNVPSIDAGLPSDLLVNRPDLASAEAQLRAADADVAAARAALLPSVQLTASLGRSASQLFSLSHPADSSSWSLSLAQSLFDGGRLGNQVKISESRRLALIEQYRKSILVSLQETEDALDRVQVTQAQEDIQRQLVAEARRSLQLTEARYREGSNDLMSLLDAQRSLFQAEDSLVQQRLSRLNASVDLFKAIGGPVH